jgi:hypothetical protein
MKLPYIQIEKEAKSLSEARQRAEQIKYSYKIGKSINFRQLSNY